MKRGREFSLVLFAMVLASLLCALSWPVRLTRARPALAASAAEPAFYLKNLTSAENKAPASFTFIYNDKEQVVELPVGGDVKSKVVGRSLEARAKLMQSIYQMGFSQAEAAHYAFSELDAAIEQIEKEVYVAPTNARLSSQPNSGKVKIKNAKMGIEVDKNALFCEIFNKLSKKEVKNPIIKIPTTSVMFEVGEKELESCTTLRSSFKTYFGASNAERKNNIRLALACFDGLVMESGQTISFNEVTGERTAEKGYQQAKIIKQGSFVNATGGGVCQVSTTIYNSALLAGLEIVEVHPHSLPVSYIEPCFDAMVNSGSSDLKIKNTTGQPIVFAVSNKDDNCLVNIYGCKNNTKIVRKSEKTEQLLQINTEYTSNYTDYGLDAPLESGEVVVSPGKPGYKAAGYLQYWQDGVLRETKKIRENTYMPTKRVVLVP